ncbi:hypothetical protein BH11PSE8_BH11PSE8_06430 [soil metagenome]
MPTSPPDAILDSRIFTADDQRFFAEASHDVNPMHMDPVAARRLVSGRQVVHGVHTLLVALEKWIERSGVVPSGVKCQFINPVNVGDLVTFSQFPGDLGLDQASIVASVGDLPCAELSIDSTTADTMPTPVASVEHSRGTVLPRLDRPLEMAPVELAGMRFTLTDSQHQPLAQRFPHLADALGLERLAAIATLSQFVGMVCPGLHSVFSSVSLEFGGVVATGSRLSFVVRKYDARFGLFIIGVEGTLVGEIRAFLRPPPQAQASMDEVCGRVQRGEFDGHRTLVIGGSRGLGETVAKIVAAGGGDVIVSHATGVADARRVADEITLAGRGACTTVHLDLTVSGFAEAGIEVASLDTVYFFATPRIFRKKTGRFDRMLFDEFALFYLERFTELCEWLEARAVGRPVTVYLPSTVFITERPRGMTEYAMVKAAAELLADDSNRSFRNVRIVHQRLPRLATDQTASIMKLATESPLEVLLPMVRQIHQTQTARLIS